MLELCELSYILQPFTIILPFIAQTIAFYMDGYSQISRCLQSIVCAIFPFLGVASFPNFAL